MRCAKAQRSISRRLDGALSEKLEATLENHLARCEACRTYAKAMANIGLDLLCVPEPAPDFTMRAVQRLGDVPAPRWTVFRRPAVFRPIAAGLGVAAALGGFAVGSLLWPASDRDTTVRNGTVELAAVSAFDPLAEDPIETVLITMVSNGEE